MTEFAQEADLILSSSDKEFLFFLGHLIYREFGITNTMTIRHHFLLKLEKGSYTFNYTPVHSSKMMLSRKCDVTVLKKLPSINIAVEDDFDFSETSVKSTYDKFSN